MDEATETPEHLNPFLRAMFRKLRLYSDMVAQDEPFFIYRVPPSIREGDPSAYEPQIVSIGPFHHANPKLRAMEYHKCRYLHNLLGRRPHSDFNAVLEECIEKVRISEGRIRRCYAEPLESIGSHDLVSMMVLDGCFVLELFLSRSYGWPEHDPIHTVPWVRLLVWCDLVKLENQIPFFVLEELFIVAGGPSLTDLSLELLAIFYLSLMRGGGQLILRDDKMIYHLLHIYFLHLGPPSYESARPFVTPRSFFSFFQRVLKKVKSLTVCYCTLPRYERSLPTFRRPRCTIPCAVELWEAGIKFRRGTATNFLDVTFRGGILDIPLLSVDDATSTIIRNLVALEQCCSHLGNHFSIYVLFLDHLVNTAKDVAILERRGIIENNLGSDEEVAEFITRLGKGVMIDYGRHYLEKLFKDVNTFCGSKWHKNRAKLMRDYFGNPWSFISVVAAFVLLVMTLIQVIYAVISYQK